MSGIMAFGGAASGHIKCPALWPNDAFALRASRIRRPADLTVGAGTRLRPEDA